MKHISKFKSDYSILMGLTVGQKCYTLLAIILVVVECPVIIETKDITNSMMAARMSGNNISNGHEETLKNSFIKLLQEKYISDPYKKNMSSSENEWQNANLFYSSSPSITTDDLSKIYKYYNFLSSKKYNFHFEKKIPVHKTKDINTTLSMKSEAFLPSLKHSRKRRDMSNICTHYFIYKLDLSLILRKNLVTMFGIILSDQYNYIKPHLYSALHLICNAVRLRQIPLLNVISTVLRSQSKPFQEQFRFLLKELKRHAPPNICTSFDIWLEIIDTDWSYVLTLLNEKNNPSNIHFQSGMEMKLANLILEQDLLCIASSSTETSMENAFSKLISTIRSKDLKVNCDLFVNILLYIQLEKFIPEVDEAQNYMKDVLKNKNYTECSEKAVTDAGAYRLVHSILKNFIESTNIEYQIKECAEIIFPYIHPPYPRQHSSESNNPVTYKSILNFITESEFPHSIIDARNSLLLYNKVLIPQIMKEYMQYYYKTPWENLIVILERMRRSSMLEPKSQNCLAAIRSHVIFKFDIWNNIEHYTNRTFFYIHLSFDSFANPGLPVIYQSIHKTIISKLCRASYRWPEILQKIPFESTDPKKTALSLIKVLDFENVLNYATHSNEQDCPCISLHFNNRELPNNILKEASKLLPHINDAEKYWPLYYFLKYTLDDTMLLAFNVSEFSTKAELLVGLIKYLKDLRIMKENPYLLNSLKYYDSILNPTFHTPDKPITLFDIKALLTLLPIRYKIGTLFHVIEFISQLNLKHILYSCLNMPQYQTYRVFFERIIKHATEVKSKLINSEMLLSIKQIEKQLTSEPMQLNLNEIGSVMNLLPNITCCTNISQKCNILTTLKFTAFFSSFSTGISKYSTPTLILKDFIKYLRENVSSFLDVCVLNSLEYYEKYLECELQPGNPTVNVDSILQYLPNHENYVGLRNVKNFLTKPTLTELLGPKFQLTRYQTPYLLFQGIITHAKKSNIFEKDSLLLKTLESHSTVVCILSRAQVSLPNSLLSLLSEAEKLTKIDGKWDIFCGFLTQPQLLTILGPDFDICQYLTPIEMLHGIVTFALKSKILQDDVILCEALHYYNELIQTLINPREMDKGRSISYDDYPVISDYPSEIRSKYLKNIPVFPSLILLNFRDVKRNLTLSKMQRSKLSNTISSNLTEPNKHFPFSFYSFRKISLSAKFNNNSFLVHKLMSGIPLILSEIPFREDDYKNKIHFINLLTTSNLLRTLLHSFSNYHTFKSINLILQEMIKVAMNMDVIKTDLYLYQNFRDFGRSMNTTRSLPSALLPEKLDSLIKELPHSADKETTYRISEFLASPYLFQILGPTFHMAFYNKPILQLKAIISHAIQLENVRLDGVLWTALKQMSELLTVKHLNKCTVSVKDMNFILQKMPDLLSREYYYLIRNFLLNSNLTKKLRTLDICECYTPEEQLQKIMQYFLISNCSGSITKELHEALNCAVQLLEFCLHDIGQILADVSVCLNKIQYEQILEFLRNIPSMTIFSKTFNLCIFSDSKLKLQIIINSFKEYHRTSFIPVTEIYHSLLRVENILHNKTACAHSENYTSEHIIELEEMAINNSKVNSTKIETVDDIKSISNNFYNFQDKIITDFLYNISKIVPNNAFKELVSYVSQLSDKDSTSNASCNRTLEAHLMLNELPFTLKEETVFIFQDLINNDTVRKEFDICNNFSPRIKLKEFITFAQASNINSEAHTILQDIDKMLDEDFRKSPCSILDKEIKFIIDVNQKTMVKQHLKQIIDLLIKQNSSQEISYLFSTEKWKSSVSDMSESLYTLLRENENIASYNTLFSVLTFSKPTILRDENVSRMKDEYSILHKSIEAMIEELSLISNSKEEKFIICLLNNPNLLYIVSLPVVTNGYHMPEQVFRLIINQIKRTPLIKVSQEFSEALDSILNKFGEIEKDNCPWNNDMNVTFEKIPQFVNYKTESNNSSSDFAYVQLTKQLQDMVISNQQRKLAKWFLRNYHLEGIFSDVSNYHLTVLEFRYGIKISICSDKIILNQILYKALKICENVVDKLVHDTSPSNYFLYSTFQEILPVYASFLTDPSFIKIFKKTFTIPAIAMFPSKPNIKQILQNNSINLNKSLSFEANTLKENGVEVFEIIAETVDTEDIFYMLEELESNEEYDNHHIQITNFMNDTHLGDKFGPAFNISHYLSPFFKFKAIITEAKTLTEVQTNDGLRKAVEFYKNITDEETNEQKLYLLSEFLGNEYLLESFEQSFELNNIPTSKLQLQEIINHAMCAHNIYIDLYEVLYEFNNTLNRCNPALSPFPDFIQIIEYLPCVPNADVHLPAFVSFLINPDNLGVNFNISKYPNPILKLHAIIKEVRDSNKKSNDAFEAALDKYEKALANVIETILNEFNSDTPT